MRVGYYTRSYYSLSDDDLINLLQTSPIAIAISSNRWELYSSGVFSCTSTAAVDHAVLLIGYTPNYWIVKNQWGTNWGENGFIRITRNPSANCQIGTSAHIMYEGLLGVNILYILMVMGSFIIIGMY
jgi:hypothetical protein